MSSELKATKLLVQKNLKTVFYFSGLFEPKVLAITVASGALAYVAYYFIKRRLDRIPPKRFANFQRQISFSYLVHDFRWRKVGEVTDLLCFPIKSCGVIRLDEFECEQIGLQKGNIRDRTFMVVRTDGEFVTGRTYPKLVQVSPQIEGDEMILSAPGMIDLTVDFARLFTVTPIKANVWGQTVDAVDCGEEAARWFSRYILQEDFGFRFVFYPSSLPTREVRPKNKIFDTTVQDDTGALHDATSFVLINENSINELNSRVNIPVTPSQFRPNIVIKGPSAFEEDDWKWVKIGDEVIFRNVKPCTR